MSFINELKRRNVFRVGAAYVILGWLLMQVGEVMAPALHLPDWILSALAFFLILGFPIALFFAWAFEMTPEGLRREKDVDRAQSITPVTGRKLDVLVIGLLVVALGWFAWDKWGAEPGSESSASVPTLALDSDPIAAQPTPVQSDRSIAVLPFVNMSSDTEQEYFSDGLSEELLNLLAKIPQLQVAARTSSFSFKGQNIEIREIARKLGVAHVLEGSVRKSGDQVRITAQLIKADDGFHLWSETWDRTLDDVFAIQDEIARHVVEELRITLLGTAPTVAETDPEAYRLYLEGRHFRYQSEPASLVKAIDLLQQSVAIDPDYAPAWAELAYAMEWHTGSGYASIEESYVLIDQAIANAMAADPQLAMAWFAQGVRNAYFQFDFKKGIEDFHRAHELEPGNALFVAVTGTSERLMGRFDNAIEIYLDAVNLDPVMPETLANLGLAYWSAGRMDEALVAINKALALSPDYVGLKVRKGRVYLEQGKPELALETMLDDANDTYRNSGLAMVYHSLGDSEEANHYLHKEISEHADTAAIQIAEIYAWMNRPDEAFEWLDKAYEIRDSGMTGILGNRAYRSLLRDPRWPDLLKKVGFHEAWLEMPPEWGGPQP